MSEHTPGPRKPVQTVDREKEMRAFAERFLRFMPNCAQLIDGLKDPPSWSAWDQSVRDELTELAHMAEEFCIAKLARAALPEKEWE